jgi:hypothetical protein
MTKIEFNGQQCADERSKKMYLQNALYGVPINSPYRLKAVAIVLVPGGKPATYPMSSSNVLINVETF